MSRFAPNRIPGRGIPQIRTTTPAVQIHQSSSTERVRHLRASRTEDETAAATLVDSTRSARVRSSQTAEERSAVNLARRTTQASQTAEERSAVNLARRTTQASQTAEERSAVNLARRAVVGEQRSVLRDRVAEFVYEPNNVTGIYPVPTDEELSWHERNVDSALLRFADGSGASHVTPANIAELSGMFFAVCISLFIV